MKYEISYLLAFKCAAPKLIGARTLTASYKLKGYKYLLPFQMICYTPLEMFAFKRNTCPSTGGPGKYIAYLFEILIIQL